MAKPGDVVIIDPGEYDDCAVWKTPNLTIQAAGQPVIFWIKDRPQPHANGLRYLSTIGSEKIKPQLKEWAFPKDPLPKEGAQPPFPSSFETAQSALRYLGRMKDEETFPRLLEQLKRKTDKKMDITQDGLQGAGLAMLGMALRAVAYGALTSCFWRYSR